MPSRGRPREAAAPSHAGLSTVMPRTRMTWQLDVPRERENRREATVPFMTRPWSHTRRFCLVPFARTEAFGPAPRVSRGKAGRSAEGSGVIRAPHTPAPAPQLTVRIPGPIARPSPSAPSVAQPLWWQLGPPQRPPGFWLTWSPELAGSLLGLSKGLSIRAEDKVLSPRAGRTHRWQLGAWGSQATRAADSLK